MPRILFLYATNNCGHQKAAQAIQNSIKAIDPEAETAGIDFFTYHYPNLGPIISKIYVEVMQYIPQTWNYIYDSPDVASFTKEFRQMFNLLNIPKLYEDIRRFEPHIIVCTQAIPSGFIAQEKQKGRISLPLFVVITDFVANPYWPDNNISGYFVPDEEIRQALISRRIPEKLIQVTGIPVDSAFSQKTPKKIAKRKLGLRPEQPVILIMGGSLGLGQIPEAVKELLAYNADLQLLVVTGHNKHLYSYMEKTYCAKKNVILFEHTNNISILMDAADILISKPGGMTSAEALVKSLPMIILSPLPGQEERNTVYLLKRKVAERCSEPAQLPVIIDNFLRYPQKHINYSQNTFSVSHPDASRVIASQIMQFMAQKKDPAVV